MNLWKRALFLAAAALIVTTPLCLAGEYEAKADGPFFVIEEINVSAYGNADYYSYLGKGYVPMLEKAKADGLIMDWGVMEYQTGQSGDANVIIWFGAASMADLEKAGDAMDAMASEMRTPDEWKAMTDKMAKIRSIGSRNFARAVTFTKKEKAIPFTCDVHSWMSAFCFVLDHPFFTTTDASGSFSIEGLPDGEYEMGAWHEKWGEQSFKVTVSGGAVSADVEFTQ